MSICQYQFNGVVITKAKIKPCVAYNKKSLSFMDALDLVEDEMDDLLEKFKRKEIKQALEDYVQNAIWIGKKEIPQKEFDFLGVSFRDVTHNNIMTGLHSNEQDIADIPYTPSEFEELEKQVALKIAKLQKFLSIILEQNVVFETQRKNNYLYWIF